MYSKRKGHISEVELKAKLLFICLGPQENIICSMTHINFRSTYRLLRAVQTKAVFCTRTLKEAFKPPVVGFLKNN